MQTALSLLVLTALALMAGGLYLWRSRGLKKQGLLMIALAAVMAINVAIWTLPNEHGNTLIEAAPE